MWGNSVQFSTNAAEVLPAELLHLVLNPTSLPCFSILNALEALHPPQLHLDAPEAIVGQTSMTNSFQHAAWELCHHWNLVDPATGRCM